MFHSSDTCLDRENYEEFNLPTEITKLTAILEKPEGKTDAGKKNYPDK